MLTKDWKKSSRSPNGDCVEARFVDGVIEVRNSNDRDGGLVRFTPNEWNAFIPVAADEFKIQ